MKLFGKKISHICKGKALDVWGEEFKTGYHTTVLFKCEECKRRFTRRYEGLFDDLKLFKDKDIY